jgi:4-amino-4-deoxy-L-arabinose transferase-like glycosyltransferase
MNTKSSPLKLETLLLWGILAVALIARFRYLVYIEHNIDQAYPIWQALNTLDNGIFPTIGQGTSVLFANAPMTGYLYLPIVALTRSILGVEILVIALNTLAVWMAYRVACHVLGTRWALLVALIMAVNPFMIEYSRATWVQSLLPFYATAILWQLTPVLLNKTRYPARRLIISAILLALVANSYLLAFLWGVPIAILLLIFYKRVNWRVVIIGAGIFIIITTPYAITLITDWGDIQAELTDFGQNPSRITPDGWEHAVRLVTGARYEIVRGVDAPAGDMSNRHAITEMVHYVGLLMIFIGIGGALTALFRRTSQKEVMLIVLIWFFIPIIPMSYTGNLVHPFYQLLGVPMGAVLAVLGMKTLKSLLPPLIQLRYTVLGLGLIVFWACLMLINSGRFGEETAHTVGAHGLGALPIKVGMQLGNEITPDGTVFADMPEWVMNTFAGRTFPLIRDNRAPSFAIYPADGGTYITVGSDAPLNTSEKTLNLTDGTLIHIYHLPSHEQILDMVAVRMDVPTTQGLRLIGYTLTENAIQLFWQVDFIAPEVKNLILGSFVHVYDAQNERVINTGGGALEGWRWRVGDIFVDDIPLNFPADGRPFTIQFGQYDGVHGVNLQFDFPNDDLPASTVMIIDVP